jgi:phosphate transport system substrate-binding protein
MRKKLFVASLMLVSVFLISCLAFAGGAKDEEGMYAGDHSMGGSTTVMPIMEAAIEAFEEEYPAANLSYDGQGSSVGVQGALDGVYELGGSSRKLKDKEENAGAVATPVALDGIAVIANENVPLDDLSLEDVAAIFAGDIRNWSELGGPDAPIVVINRDEASGTRAAFHELVLEEAIGDDASFIMDAITVESNGDMVTKVGQTPDSIGYCGFGYIDQARNMGAKTLSVNGGDATVANVLDEKYPVSRKLFVVTDGQPEEGFETAFIEFLLSDEGQELVEEAGFIALP